MANVWQVLLHNARVSGDGPTTTALVRRSNANQRRKPSEVIRGKNHKELSEEKKNQIRTIRRLAQQGTPNLKLSKQFNMSTKAVSNIVRGVSYGRVI